VQSSSAAGHAFWLAPELLKGQQYDEKVDVFAFGVILFQLAFYADDKPYGGLTKAQVDFQVRHREWRSAGAPVPHTASLCTAPTVVTFFLPTLACASQVVHGLFSLRSRLPSSTVAPEVLALVEECLSEDPAERPSMAQVIWVGRHGRVRLAKRALMRAGKCRSRDTLAPVARGSPRRCASGWRASRSCRRQTQHRLWQAVCRQPVRRPQEHPWRCMQRREAAGNAARYVFEECNRSHPGWIPLLYSNRRLARSFWRVSDCERAQILLGFGRAGKPAR
jgi:hypothetical protein